MSSRKESASFLQSCGWLAAALVCMFATTTFGADPRNPGGRQVESPRVPLLSDEEAWKRLPPVESGGGHPLPTWARALAGSLPYTTAAMLELDRTYRTSDSLDPKLAAAIRLTVARTLRSDYGIAYAEADLRRAGLDKEAIERLGGDRTSLPKSDRAVLAFADRMTTAGYSSTDEEVAELVATFGEAKVVAIVLQIAYTNFLYRMVLALGLPVETGGPLPPPEVRFADSTLLGSKVPAATRPAPLPGLTVGETVQNSDAEWGLFDYKQLQERLEAQRGRKPRVSIPTWEEFRQAIPASLYPRAKPLRIRWSLLVSGRQPKLGPAWIKCTRAFEAEAKQDRIFEESLFWVVTRTLRCFYCMGHCEMLLEVGGLDRKAIADRTAQLAGDDWSRFTPLERAAFGFARKLTRTPWEVDANDINRLTSLFGHERALDVVWWSSRCQYMTKISDAFQLQLERENVFGDSPSPPKESK
jgi:alkylhydroperoxidase family enzyme